MADICVLANHKHNSSRHEQRQDQHDDDDVDSGVSVDVDADVDAAADVHSEAIKSAGFSSASQRSNRHLSEFAAEALVLVDKLALECQRKLNSNRRSDKDGDNSIRVSPRHPQPQLPHQQQQQQQQQNHSRKDSNCNNITSLQLTKLTIDNNHHSNDDHNTQCGYPKRVRSLVDDAKFDSQRNRELAAAVAASLDEEETEAGVGASLDSSGRASTSAAVALGKQIVELKPILVSSPRESLDASGKSLEAGEPSLADEPLELQLEVKLRAAEEMLDFPRHISQLDECHHLLIKYEPELDPTHPGFHDLEYRERRKEVAQIAFNYKYGDRIPEVVYNQKEIDTWRYIYTRLKEAYGRYACEQHNKAIGELEKHCGYSPNRIPQLQQVSEFLEQRTGWRLRPAAGLLSARDFLASLAYRVFQTTQYIRHWGNPEHSVEPDCIHELMGHIPMLCDPSFAQFSQEIGLASLGASDQQIEKFATLYWFTVEFGLCRENGQLKCYGAGLLSSYGEMEHALESGKPALKEFVPEETAVETYDDAEYQVVYYVAESFDEAKAKIKDYAGKHLKRAHELAYDPYSCSVRTLDSTQRLAVFVEQIKSDVLRLSSALAKLNSAGGESDNCTSIEVA